MNSSKPIIVLLDTNFLMVPIRFGVDIQAELERVIEVSFKLTTIPAVIEELKMLKNRVKPGEEKEISFALAVADKITLLDYYSNPNEEVDDQLLRLADRVGYVVATTDTGLRRRLRSRGFPVIFLRQSRYLSIDGIF